jgi:hypothetical protein
MRQIIVAFENQTATRLEIEGTPICLVVLKPEREGSRIKPALIGGSMSLLVPDAPSGREITRLFAEATRLAEAYNQAAGIDGEQLRYTRSAVNRWTA